MKYTLPALAIALTLATLSPALAADADVDGASPGKWTMDLDAAKKLAAEKDLPILVNFSGSDWCSWCKVMEKNVFSKDEWAAYAKDNLVMVLIDFPRNKDLVPEKYRERNNDLKEKYGVRGYPTFIVFDCDGKTELGRLRAGRDKTPKIVQGELAELFRYCKAEVEKYAEGLDGDAGKDYLGIIEDIGAAKEEIAELEESIAEAKKEIETKQEEVTDLLDAARAFRAEQLGEKEFEEYKKLKAELDAAQKDLEDWLETGPDRSPQTQKLYKEKSERISAIAQKLAKY